MTGIIEGTVNDLIARNPSSMPVALHLASLQAFLILHSIQLWDGDSKQRALAETHARVIEDWALLLHIRLIGSKDKLSTSKSTWSEWIILESARRTVLITLLAQAAYEVSKYGACTYIPLMADLPFTTNDGPWNAKDMDQWMEEIRDQGTQIATYVDFSTRWKSVRGNLDSFAKLLLVPCLGVTYRDCLAF